MKVITTEELHRKLEEGPLALFDVSGDVEYEMGHIPGAKTAPLGSLVFRVRRVMNADSFVVVYSGGDDSNLSAEAANRLENLGMRNIHCYLEGLEGWKAAGHPVVESVDARIHARGPVTECRSIVVDREKAYGGIFKGKPVNTEAAGG